LENKLNIFYWVDKLIVDENYIICGIENQKGSTFVLYDLETENVKYDIAKYNKYKYNVMIKNTNSNYNTQIFNEKNNESCNDYKMITAGNDNCI